MWIALALVAAVCEASRGAFGKVAGRQLDSYSLALGMVALQAVFLSPIVFALGVPAVTGGFYVALLCASLLDVGGTLLYVRALKSGDLSIAIPLMSFTPLLALLMLPLVLWKVRDAPRVIAGSWRALLPAGVFSAGMAISQMLALSDGLVVYVASIKNLSALFAVVIGSVVFDEAGLKERLVGAGLMVIGAGLIVAA